MAFRRHHHRRFRRRLSRRHSAHLFRATHHLRKAARFLSRGGRRL